MDEKRFKRIKTLHRAVVDLTTGERRTFLETVCPGDPEIRGEVEGLAEQETTDLARGMRREAGRILRGTTEAERIGPGDRIGPYKLLRKVGESGMGLVFEAEQEEPIHGPVALKAIKPGMDSRQVLVVRRPPPRTSLSYSCFARQTVYGVLRDTVQPGRWFKHGLWLHILDNLAIVAVASFPASNPQGTTGPRPFPVRLPWKSLFRYALSSVTRVLSGRDSNGSRLDCSAHYLGTSKGLSLLCRIRQLARA